MYIKTSRCSKETTGKTSPSQKSRFNNSSPTVMIKLEYKIVVVQILVLGWMQYWLDHFTLSNNNIVNAVCLQLGKAIPCLQSLDRCVAQCGHPIDIEGYHTMTCKWGSGSSDNMTVYSTAFMTCPNLLDFTVRKS